MIIGGIEKCSLIDYPGRISQVVFLSGCNFSCPYCHNPSLVNHNRLFSAELSEQEIISYLERRLRHIDGVVISGGEPTIHSDLPSLCEKIHRIGYPIKLDTNGSMPKVLVQLINEGLIDYIAMDIKTDPHTYSPVVGREYGPEHILSSIRIIMESSMPHEFRTTCVKPFVDEPVVEKIARLIHGAMLYVLQQFRPDRILQPQFFRDMDPAHTEAELIHLRSIAEPWVEKCIIR